jgi:hypothetical protein
MMNRSCEVAETTVKRLLCCWFRCTSKAMGQAYQSVLVEDVSRNKCSFQVRISRVLRSISICVLFIDSPSYYGLAIPTGLHAFRHPEYYKLFFFFGILSLCETVTLATAWTVQPILFTKVFKILSARGRCHMNMKVIASKLELFRGAPKVKL